MIINGDFRVKPGVKKFGVQISKFAQQISGSSGQHVFDVQNCEFGQIVVSKEHL